MDRIEHKIDYIVTKVDRIDTQVAENNLRHALEHVLQRSVSLEGVDLKGLATLCPDFDKFMNSLSSPLLLNFGLQLSSDIRDQLQQIYALAYEIRRLIARHYNISTDGDPERVIIVKPTEDYYSKWGSLKILIQETILRRHVMDKVIGEKSQDFLSRENRGYLPFKKVINNVMKKNSQKLLNDEIDPFSEIFRAKCSLYEFLPEDIFKDEAPEALEQELYDLCCAWLYNTDAGLLHRTGVELEGIADGYENTFWPQLQEAEPCGFKQIDVACDVPLLENT